MNLTNRYSVATVLNMLALLVFASGCIVVVKEDQDDRRRYLHGSEWILEVVFYRTQTMTLADRAIEIQFLEDGTISGRAACGMFSGEFDVNENDGITISSVVPTDSCVENDALRLVSSRLQEARTYTVSESDLTISTKSEGYLSFQAK